MFLILICFVSWEFAFSGTCPRSVLHGITSCYYADSVNGSDTNSGASRNAPWLHLPGMTNCSDLCASTTPSAGEGFILRGGDTWKLNGNPNWAWTWSGTSVSPIYVGVDTTWTNGTNSGTVSTSGSLVTWVSGDAFQMNGSWVGGTININGIAYAIASIPNPYILNLTTSAGTQTGVAYNNTLFKRPVIDGQGMASKLLNAAVSYVVFDSLELTGAMDQNDNQDGSFNTGSSQGNVTLKNAYVHNFRHCTGNGTPTSYCTGALTVNDGASGGVEVGLYSGLNGSAMTLMNSNVGSPEDRGNYGACSRGMQILAYNYFHDCSDANDHGGTLVHDNIVRNVGNTFDGTTHTDIFYLDALTGTSVPQDGSLTSYVYNNLIEDTQANSGATIIYPNPGSSGGTGNSTVTFYIFNNVITNTGSGANGQIGDNIDPYGAPAGMIMNVYDWNNTYELSSNLPCVRVTSRTVNFNIVDVRNLHCVEAVAPTGSTLFSTESAVISPYSSNLLGQSIGTAKSQGFTAPLLNETSFTALTLRAGTNLTGYCSGSLIPLCASSTAGGYFSAVGRPTKGAWDIGAYQSPPPSPPAGLKGVAR